MLDLDDTITDRQATIRVYARRFLSDFGDRLDGVDLAALTAGISRVDGNGYNRNRAVELAASAGWRASPGADVLAEHWERHFAELTQGRDGLAAVVDAMERAGLRLGVVTNGRTHLQLRA